MNAWSLFDKLALSKPPEVRRALALAIKAMARHAVPDARRDQWKTLASSLSLSAA